LYLLRVVRRGRRAGGVSPASATMAEVELRRRIRHRRWLRRQRNPVSSQGGAMPHREERLSDPQVRYMGQNVRSLKSVERQSDDFSRTYDMFWCISCGAQTKTMEVVTSFRAASIVILAVELFHRVRASYTQNWHVRAVLEQVGCAGEAQRRRAGRLEEPVEPAARGTSHPPPAIPSASLKPQGLCTGLLSLAEPRSLFLPPTTP